MTRSPASILPGFPASQLPHLRRRLGRLPVQAIAGLCLLFAIALVAGTFREPLLTAMGRALSLEENLERSDAILVSYATDRSGVHHAADLYFAGYARLIVVSNAKVDMPGVAARNLSELFRAELTSLGVPDEAIAAVETVPTSTQEEASAVQEVFSRHGVKSAILVTAAPRMRRSLLTLRRLMGKDGARLIPSPVAPADFDLERWWETRQGVSAVVLNEYPRLLYYWLRGRF